jgi:hypothetical protein
LFFLGQSLVYTFFNLNLTESAIKVNENITPFNLIKQVPQWCCSKTKNLWLFRNSLPLILEIYSNRNGLNTTHFVPRFECLVRNPGLSGWYRLPYLRHRRPFRVNHLLIGIILKWRFSDLSQSYFLSLNMNDQLKTRTPKLLRIFLFSVKNWCFWPDMDSRLRGNDAVLACHSGRSEAESRNPCKTI